MRASSGIRSSRNRSTVGSSEKGHGQVTRSGAIHPAIIAFVFSRSTYRPQRAFVIPGPKGITRFGKQFSAAFCSAIAALLFPRPARVSLAWREASFGASTAASANSFAQESRARLRCLAHFLVQDALEEAPPEIFGRDSASCGLAEHLKGFGISAPQHQNIGLPEPKLGDGLGI